MRCVPLLLALAFASALASGCGAEAPIPEIDQWIGIEVGADEVETGAAFPLTVVRVWSEALVPAAWDDRFLTPLTLRLESLAREEDGTRVRETRRYRAYAFALEDVAIRAVPFAARPRAGGAVRAVHAEALRIAVRPALEPDALGRPELPGPLPPGPAPVAPWIWVGIAVLVSSLGAWWRLRRHVPPEVELAIEEPEAPAPAALALEALERVRMCSSGDPAADVVETAEIVREYVDGQLAVRAPYHSTEEVLAAPALDDGPRRRLARLLRLSDLTKFATHEPTPEECQEQMAGAEAFVRETANGAAS